MRWLTEARSRSRGLDRQTGDKAFVQGHYYSDKLPGCQCWRRCPTLLPRLFTAPDHPLNRAAFPYWAADYWATLGTSGILDRLDRGPPHGRGWRTRLPSRQAGLIGLAYGCDAGLLYATLAVGHQASAFALFGSFFCCGKGNGRASEIRVFPRASWRLTRSRHRASGRACVGDPRLLSSRAMSPTRARAWTDTFDFLVGGPLPDCDAADLQPARVWFTLGDGLFSSCHHAVRRGP